MQFTPNKREVLNTASFFKDLKFSDTSVVITSLLESDFGKEIRIAFQKGQVMKEHKTKFPITVMTLKGSISFNIEQQTVILSAGDVISVKGNVLHELKALEESVVRLSLHKNDTISRVQSVLKL